MSASKTERLVNLLICLLATRRFLTVAEIFEMVPGYGGTDPGDEAFRRSFERDKRELRELGVPLETGTNSWGDDEGYRIKQRDYELQPIELEPDEAAALGLAARLWQSAGLAAATRGALLKLRAAGVDPDEATLPGLEPRVDASEPAFEPCLQAVREGRVVRFDYQGSSAAVPAQREVEPWGVVSWRGRWYLVGHDRDRAGTRAFRLSRISGDVKLGRTAGEVTPPADLDLVALAAQFGGTAATREAAIRVRAGKAYALRRDAGAVEPAGDGWDLVRLPFSDAERLADLVAEFGADAVVLEPADARDAVVTRLRGVLGESA